MQCEIEVKGTLLTILSHHFCDFRNFKKREREKKVLRVGENSWQDQKVPRRTSLRLRVNGWGGERKKRRERPFKFTPPEEMKRLPVPKRVVGSSAEEEEEEDKGRTILHRIYMGSGGMGWEDLIRKAT